jgi:hypothetical protein
MWMGVTTRRPNIAVLKTIAFVRVVPWFVKMLLQGFAVMFFAFTFRGSGTVMPFWVPYIAIGVLGIGADLMFFFIARHKLVVNFRRTVAGAAGLATRRHPPPLQPPPAMPPAPPPFPVPPPIPVS